MISAARRKRNKLRGSSLSRFIGRQFLIIAVRLYSVQASERVVLQISSVDCLITLAIQPE